jgi:hypothetical protein
VDIGEPRRTFASQRVQNLKAVTPLYHARSLAAQAQSLTMMREPATNGSIWFAPPGEITLLYFFLIPAGLLLMRLQGIRPPPAGERRRATAAENELSSWV